MKTILYFCIMTVLTSCLSCHSLDTEETDINPIFQSGVETFALEAAHRHVRVNIAGLRIRPGDLLITAGVYYHHTHEIVIDTTDYIYQINPEWILFHELGHALLKRPHKQGILDSIFPVSIMDRWRVPNQQDYARRRNYYLDELFGNSP